MLRNILKEGHKSKAICEDCKKVVNTTLVYRDVPFSGKIIKHILCGICNNCLKVVSFPAQSTKDIIDQS